MTNSPEQVPVEMELVLQLPGQEELITRPIRRIGSLGIDLAELTTAADTMRAEHDLPGTVPVLVRNPLVPQVAEEKPIVRTFADGRIRVLPEDRVMRVDGRPMFMNKRTFNLVELLSRQPGRVYPHDQIVANLWGVGLDPQSKANSLRVILANLRNDLSGIDPQLHRAIGTVRKVGYFAREHLIAEQAR
jgi:DNA-binding response OmpR family regulator